nr:ATP-binding protein [Corynebacterium lactis]
MPSIEMSVLRAGALIIAVTGALWQFESVTRSIPLSEFQRHWFPFASLFAFALSDVLLLVAFALRTRRALVMAFRVPMYIMLALLAFAFTYVDVARTPIGNPLWFSPFAGLALVAFSLTVPLRISLSIMAFVPGLIAVLNSWLLGHTFWLNMLSDVGFNLVNTFPFVIFAGSSRSVARLIDDTYAQSRKVAEHAERVRVRGEAMGTFTAYVHDYVLAALSAIGKGMKVDFSLDAKTGQFFSPNDSISGARFAERVVAVVGDICPEAEMTVDIANPSEPVRISGEVANTLLLAVSEVATNSRKHAGPDAKKWGQVEINSGLVRITFSDDGAGFDAATIDSHRAGVRLSVKGRVDSLRGGEASVTSAPGKGTTAVLTWQGNTSPVADDSRDQGEKPEHAASIYRMLGMSIVFSWQYYLTLVATMVIVLTSNEQLFSPAGQLGLSAFAAIAGVLMLGRFDQLPAGRTLFVAVGLVLLSLIGLYQPIPSLTEWSYMWHFNVVALLAAILAIRGRPTAAVLSILVAFGLIELADMAGWAPNPQVTGMDLLLRSVIVVAGVLTGTMLGFLSRNVPNSMQEYNRALSEAAAAKEFERSQQNNFEWLEAQVGPIFAAATAMGTPTERLSKRSRLTEEMLRDVLRSPRLSNPALHQSVWDARARGVKVRLLDDRHHEPLNASTVDVRQFPLIDEDAAVRALLPEFLRAIDSAEDGAVTIRLLPPGRRAFASISDNNGVHRFNSSGERI